METNENTIELQEILNTFKLRKNIIGVGGTGLNIVQRATEVDMQRVELVSIDVDSTHLDIVPIENKYLICQDPTGGAIFSSVEEDKEERDTIDEIIEKTDITFLVCGLGGKTGTSLTPRIAEMAKEHGNFIFAICVLSFSVEGRERVEKARNALEKLKLEAETLVTIENDKWLETNKQLTMLEAYDLLDDLIVRYIKEMISPADGIRP